MRWERHARRPSRRRGGLPERQRRRMASVRTAPGSHCSMGQACALSPEANNRIIPHAGRRNPTSAAEEARSPTSTSFFLCLATTLRRRRASSPPSSRPSRAPPPRRRPAPRILALYIGVARHASAFEHPRRVLREHFPSGRRRRRPRPARRRAHRRWRRRLLIYNVVDPRRAAARASSRPSSSWASARASSSASSCGASCRSTPPR